MVEGDGMDGASAGVSSRTVFVSYASHDTEIANTICRELESRGIRCWIAPRDVAPGALYADAIVRAINECKVLLIVLSQSAVASSHVGREIERAASKHKQIIALRIDTAPLSPALEYFLSESQWIDAPALGMPAALSKLADAVVRDSAPPSKTSQAPATAVAQIGKRSVGAPKRVVVAAAIVAVVGATATLALRFWSLKNWNAQAPVTAPISDKSIAVLPFADMSQKKDQEYFGDGMAEEILDLLAKIPGLTVIGRTSSFQFKGKNEDLRTIGTKLNAAYVLEGSVRNSGEQVRITAQLINTRTGAHEWSETYDRPIGDVLKLQDAIAAAVVRELQFTVAPSYLNSRSLLKSADAYDLYLRGRHAVDRADNEGLDEGVTLFQQALDRDPTFADPAAELASAHLSQVLTGVLSPSVGAEQARREAKIALKMEPKNVLAHVVIAGTHIVYDWDWAGAERELELAATLAPDNVDVLSGKAVLSRALGHWDDALRQINRALAQDPLSPTSLIELANIQEARGRVLEAEAATRRALDIRPTFGYAHYNLAYILLEGGERDRALLEIQQEPMEDGKQEGLAIIFHALGRKDESDRALASVLKLQADANALGVARIYAYRGQLTDAMQWLERAYAQKDPYLCTIKSEKSFKNLEPDPRYKAFLRKMHLPE